jgi:signal transduction histidine kinase
MVAWGTSVWLVWRAQQAACKVANGSVLITQMRTALVVALIVLVIIVMAVLIAQPAHTVVVVPLVATISQLLVLVGTVRLQLYTVGARVERTVLLAAQAAERERLAVVGELAATVAHEVRNPLTGVRSLAQRLAEETIDEQRRHRYAQLIVDEVSRVDRIVSNLLTLARRSPADADGDTIEATSLDGLFDDLRLLVSARAEQQGVALLFNAATIEARVSRAPLAQVLLNLLLNAIAHTPTGGRVEMVSRMDDDDVVVIVRDQGSGIPKAERDRIFEPFYTGSGGNGLGLAVVRRVAEERGWRVEVADAQGGGAELRVRISRVSAAPG